MELIVQGGPGSGKTTSSVGRVQEFIDTGLFEPDDIIAMSYTKTAAAELHRRGVLAEDNVGTMHKFGFSQLSVADGALIGGRAPRKKDATDVTALWNRDYPDWKISRSDEFDYRDPEAKGSGRGDEFLRITDQFRHTLEDISLWEPQSLSNRLNIHHMAAKEVFAFNAEMKKFKHRHGAIDFTDMIEVPYLDNMNTPRSAQLVWADECQDLTPLMWARLRQMKDHGAMVMASGDLHQLLYDHLGASPAQMLTLPADAEREELPESFRLSRSVLEYAQKWNKYNPERLDYPFSAIQSAIDGKVELDEDVTLGDGSPYIAELAAGLTRGTEDTLMILTSCNYMTNSVVSALRNSSVPFHNEYRIANGTWNPLKSKSRYVARLLDPKPLTNGDIMHWASMVKTGGTIKNWMALKEKIRNEMSATFTEWSAFVVENPEAVVRDLDWLMGHASSESENSVALAVRMLDNNPVEDVLKPRVTVGTMHSVKGGEADHVILLPDVSPAAYNSGRTGWPSICRQFYVGMTRPRNTLTLGISSSRYAVSFRKVLNSG